MKKMSNEIIAIVEKDKYIYWLGGTDYSTYIVKKIKTHGKSIEQLKKEENRLLDGSFFATKTELKKELSLRVKEDIYFIRYFQQEAIDQMQTVESLNQIDLPEY